MEYALTATKTEARAGSYYDRIVRLYELTFKFNGYARSLDQYFQTQPLPVSLGQRILDAGCGTGLLTMALLRAIRFPVSITALDLSSSSIATARKSLYYSDGRKRDVTFTQGNLLCLPFADESLDVVVTAGALEYVPLADGLAELARVIVPGGYLLHLPVHPGIAGKVLEILFRFKSHPPKDVINLTEQNFRIVHQYRFKPHHVIGWSKTAILAQKV
jgi:ubiquinone/menaquinone biosynthesis C-methylase UbiE